MKAVGATVMTFRDRVDAGRRLAAAAEQNGLADEAGVVVLGIPRGGVPVAFEVALALGAPLDLIAVRKLGVPWHAELAMGAIGEDGVRVLNEQVLARTGVSDADVAAVEQRERTRLREQVALRGKRRRVPLAGRVAVIVDDGVATGSTARAACEVARAQGARQVVLATPVASADTPGRFSGVADRVLAVLTPRNFAGVGQFYDDFRATPDESVTDLLERAAAR
jgi:putative phosphoribosyl transferase